MYYCLTMPPLLLITLCTEISPQGKENYALFHFKGAWNGHFIKKICLEFRPDAGQDVQVGQEYIILMAPHKVEQSTLFGHIKKISPLEDFE